MDGFYFGIPASNYQDMDPSMIVERKELFMDRGIYLDSNRDRHRIEPVVDLHYRKSDQPLWMVEKAEDGEIPRRINSQRMIL